MKKKKRTFRYIQDPGHGWLSVPRIYIEFLGLGDRISSCSYVHGNRAYLEEDCDMPLFLAAAKEIWDVTVRDSYVEKTNIRGYALYQPCKKFVKEGRVWAPVS